MFVLLSHVADIAGFSFLVIDIFQLFNYNIVFVKIQFASYLKYLLHAYVCVPYIVVFLRVTLAIQGGGCQILEFI